MAVRQQLYTLRDENLATCTNEARRIGRPVKVWRLTPAADRFFPDEHAELAINLIRAIRRTLGDEGFLRVLKSRRLRREQLLSEQIPANASFEDRLALLAEQRTRDGYLAEVRVEDDGSYLLIENHCPIHTAASVCNNLCDEELKLFQSVLGSRRRVSRVEYMQAGSRRCTYRISRSARS
ncbi:MAG TPA: transcriptional regulator [Acidobacteriota bacterium]|nr:transcriptional regulator [Acidobacteriota bacterium]